MRTGWVDIRQGQTGPSLQKQLAEVTKTLERGC